MKTTCETSDTHVDTGKKLRKRRIKPLLPVFDLSASGTNWHVNHQPNPKSANDKNIWGINKTFKRMICKTLTCGRKRNQAFTCEFMLNNFQSPAIDFISITWNRILIFNGNTYAKFKKLSKCKFHVDRKNEKEKFTYWLPGWCWKLLLLRTETLSHETHKLPASLHRGWLF